MKSRFAIVFVIALITGQTFGQAPSVYSKIGLGTIETTPTPRNIGLSQLGVAFDDPDFISYANPASFGSIDLTRLEISMVIDGDFVKDSEMKKYYSRGSFSGFSVGFPIYTPYGIGAAFGLTPFSKVRYDIVEEDNSVPSLGTSTIEHTASGGLNKLYLGTSYKTPGDFMIGASYNYYFGSTEYNSSVTFSNGAATGKYIVEYTEKGQGFTAGIITPDLSPLFSLPSLTNMKLAASLELFGNIKTDSVSSRKTTYEHDTLNSGIGNTKLPKRFLAGFSFRYMNNYNFYLEYMQQDWTGFSHGGVLEPSLKDSKKYSVGFEYRPKKDVNYDYEKLILRCGASYENLPYYINNTNINQFTVSGGLSYPLGRQNYLDIGLSYSVHGTIDNNLLQEKIVRLSAGFNFGELWFVQQEH